MKIRTEPKSLLAFDTEVANRWWWYDGKSTNRLMMFVGQWVAGEGQVQMPAWGWIIVPDVVYTGLSRKTMERYKGLPLTTRRQCLGLISRTIADADVLIGHNLTGFDLGTINGELKIANMALLPDRPVIDTLQGAKKVIGQSMSLANRLSRLPGTVEKPHVNPVVWEAAFNDFDPDALREVWNRATTDVQGHIDLFLNDHDWGYLTRR